MNEADEPDGLVVAFPALDPKGALSSRHVRFGQAKKRRHFVKIHVRPRLTCPTA